VIHFLYGLFIGISLFSQHTVITIFSEHHINAIRYFFTVTVKLLFYATNRMQITF